MTSSCSTCGYISSKEGVEFLSSATSAVDGLAVHASACVLKIVLC